MKKELIVIPAYQPADTLINFIEKLLTEFENVLVVDDGGQEKFVYIFDRIKELGAIVITHAINQGKGRALKTAINYCLLNPDLCENGIITVDADGQHGIEDIIRVANKMEEYPKSVILGCRMFDTTNVPFRSRVGNGISRKVYKWACGIDISDTQTGLRGLPFDFLYAAAKCEGEKYEYETNMLLDIKKNEVSIQEVKIKTVYENNNESSHFNPLTDSIKIYAVVLKYSASSLISAIIDYLIFILTHGMGASILGATYVARACSCLVNFSLNKRIVFSGKGNTLLELIKYLTLVVISGAISGLAVTEISMHAPNVAPVLFKIPVEIILYCFNYSFQRTFVFNNGAFQKIYFKKVYNK